MRFTSKLATILIATIAVIQLLTGAEIYRLVRDAVIEEGQGDLNLGGEQFVRQIATIENQVAGGVTVLTLDYALRQAIAAHDQDTIVSALRNHGQRVGATRMILIGTDGVISADTAAPGIAPQADGEAIVPKKFPYPALLDAAAGKKRTALVAVIDGVPSLLVVIPVLAPLPLAYVAVALPFNGELLTHLLTVSGLPKSTSLAIAIKDGAWRLTAQQAMDPNLAGWPIDLDTLNSLPTVHDTATGEAIFLKVDMATAEGSPKVAAVFAYPLSAAIGHFRKLYVVLGTAFGLGLLAAMAGAITIARGLGRPIDLIAARARRIALGDYSSAPSMPRTDEIGKLADVLESVTNAVREREARILYQAEHDPITNLPNRQALTTKIDQAIAHEKCSILVIAIVRLPEIANTVGPDITDRLMRNAAARLTNLIPGILVGAIGRASFGVCLQGRDQDGAMAEADQIFRMFEQPYCEGELTIDTSVAIGIAMGPEHGLNAADLLHHASVAQHQAAESKVQWLIYRAEADPHRPEQLSLMSDMRRGLKTGEFELRYQPKLDLRTQKIIGAEAVVRWNHLSRGQLAPDAFIGLAEHTGNIQLLTYWVIQNTLKQMSEWKDIGFELKIAVNVSVRDLEDSGLYDNIICLLENYRVNFHDFTLEITESAVMSEPTAAVQVLTRLANSGIGLSIDDFGTGHAALSYLRHLPVREIKIDKSFILDLIRNAGDQTIVKAIVELGHALNYTVTAEGVEDSQSLEILRALRCDAVQGYLISKPLRAGDFLDVVRSWNEAPATAGRIAAVRP